MRAAGDRTSSPRLTTTTWEPPAPLPAPRSGPVPVVDEGVGLAVLAGCAGAATLGEVAAAALAPLRVLPGVRAALLVEASGRRAAPVVLASDGYDCAAMAVGAVLPPDAGLPVTEAVRTGTRTCSGDLERGPCWVAVPVPRAGQRRSALLLSLVGPAPAAMDGLEGLARALGPALDRAAAAAGVAEEVALLEEGLAPGLPAAPGLVVRSRPFQGRLTGDVVALERSAATRWLLVADVSGRGAAAAVVADRLRGAFSALVPEAASPAAVLRGLDRAVAAGEERFATALVLRLEPGARVAASAGHPAPLLLTPAGLRAPQVPAGPPLGLGLDGLAPWQDVALDPAPGRLVAWTDGLLDRGQEVDLPALLARARPEALVEDVEQGCAAVGPQQDDATLVLLDLAQG